jgi:serine/threonine-protein kinase
MAPEQALGRGVSTRSDVFSFCLALYEAMTGRIPFPEDSQFNAALRSAEPREIDWPASVPLRIRRVIESGLHFDAAKRPASMAAWLDDKERAQRQIKQSRRLRWGLVVASFAAFVAAQGAKRVGETSSCMEIAAQPLWEDATRTRVRSNFLLLAPDLGGEVFERVDRHFEQWDADFQALSKVRCSIENDSLVVLRIRDSIDGKQWIIAREDVPSPERCLHQ